MGWRNDQCRKACRIIDNFLANRPTERDSLIVAVQKAFDALEQAETNCSEIPNNSDTIYRQQAIDALRDYLVEKRCPDDGTLTCRLIENEVINKLPSIQPERNMGHWIKTARWGRVYYCDQCRNYLDFDGVNAGRGSTNFCPNCGADMRGKQNDPKAD